MYLQSGPFHVKDGVGSAVKHAAADLHCTGEAQYTDDIPNPAGGLYAGLVLSSKPHARILSVDPAPALALEGVVAYFDHKDVDGNNKHGAVIHDEEVQMFLLLRKPPKFCAIPSLMSGSSAVHVTPVWIVCFEFSYCHHSGQHYLP